MTLFEYVDRQYANEREKHGVQRGNNDFKSYLSIAPRDFNAEDRFLCVKDRKKTRILFTPNQTRQYFSDADIISILCNYPNEDTIRSITNQFAALYHNTGIKFSYRINDQDFDGYGIGYYDKEECLYLWTDSTMFLNELVFLINMVLEKDRIYGIEAQNDKLKHTLCKYVSLIKHYRYRDNVSASFLKNIGYPLHNTIEELFTSPLKTKKLNSLFKKIDDFEKMGLVRD